MMSYSVSKPWKPVCVCLLCGEEDSRKHHFRQHDKFSLQDHHPRKSNPNLLLSFLLHALMLAFPALEFSGSSHLYFTLPHLNSHHCQWVNSGSQPGAPVSPFLKKDLSSHWMSDIHSLWAKSWQVSWVNQVADLYRASNMTHIFSFHHNNSVREEELPSPSYSLREELWFAQGYIAASGQNWFGAQCSGCEEVTFGSPFWQVPFIANFRAADFEKSDYTVSIALSNE